MPFRNKKLYNQENLNKIKRLRSQGFNFHDIDVYFKWPRGTSSYHLRKIAKAMKSVEGLEHPAFVPVTKTVSASLESLKNPIEATEVPKKRLSITRQEYHSLTQVVSKVAEIVQTKTNRSNALAQVENIRGILLGHDFLTRRK